MPGRKLTKVAIYAAHALPTFNTPEEKRYLKAIQKKWPDCEVLNPNGLYTDPEGKLPESEVYKKNYKKEVRRCTILTLLENQGCIPKGEYDEYECARRHKERLFVCRGGRFLPVKRVEVRGDGKNWRRYAKVVV